MESLKELLNGRTDLIGKARAILDKADADGKRPLNSEERAEYEKLDADIETACDKIDALKGQERQQHRLTQYADMLAQQPARQTSSSPIVGSDGSALSVDFGRAGQIQLAPSHPLYASLAPRCSAKYQAAFDSYLRGDKADFEQLGLMVGKDPQGGYTAPMAFVSMMIKFLDDVSTIRPLATVLPPTTAKSVGAVSFDTDVGDSDWTAEIPAADIAEDDSMRFGKRELVPHLLTKLVKSSMKMIRSSSIPVASFVAQRLAYKKGITENKAFMTGSGAQRPLGLFVASDDGIPTSRDTTAAATTTFTADELLDVQESIKPQYQQRAVWVAGRGFRLRARKLKDGQGNYLLRENGNNTPARGLTTLLDSPLIVDENAPSTFTTGLYIALYGDMSFYWIQDGMDLEIQFLDQLFSLRNQVGWLARSETDAMPVLAEAFGRLKLA